MDSRLGSPHCDFGLGFYLADSAFYAAWIASSFASESSCARPIVMVFDLPDAYVKQARVLMNDEWAQAVYYFRRGKHPQADGLKDELDDAELLQGSIVQNSEGVDCGKKPMPVNDVQQLAVKAHIARDFYQHARLAAVVLFDEPILCITFGKLCSSHPLGHELFVGQRWIGLQPRRHLRCLRFGQRTRAATSGTRVQCMLCDPLALPRVKRLV